jgi:hypothetical protein
MKVACFALSHFCLISWICLFSHGLMCTDKPNRMGGRI